MKRFICAFFIIVAFSNLLCVNVCSAESFNDVRGDEYYAEAAYYLLDKGIVSGYDDGSFGAGNSITRAEMVTMICRMLGLNGENTKGGSMFIDTVSHWASGYINAASANNIVNGYDDSTFRPDNNVLFEEAVKMIACADGMIEEDSASPDWTAPYFNYAEANGILEQTKGQRGVKASRGDIVVMIYNSIKDRVQETSIINSASYESIADNVHKTLLTPDRYISNSSISDDGTRITTKLNESVGGEDLLLLRLTAAAGQKNGKINITINGNEFSATYALCVDATDYYIPVKGITNIKELAIQLSTEAQPFQVGDVELVNYADTDVCALKTGLFTAGQTYKKIELTDNETNKVNARDILTDGKYVYAVFGGKLDIYSEQGDQLIKVSSVEGLGDTRDIDITEDGKALAITGRKNGFYIVDISDVEHPFIASQTPTLELATGGTIADNYYFVSSRYYGVEIFDISDISSPKWCSQAFGTAEYFDCSVYDGYLYIASWNPGRVLVFDVHDINKPQKVSEIKLNGTGSDCIAKNGVLYVVTGYHSADKKSQKSDPGYGMGNGFEIYDVSDPGNPVWLSETRIDGRLSYSGGNDHWRIVLSGKYAYVTNSYAGTMIVDISDPAKARKIRTIVGHIDKSSKAFKKVDQQSYVLPYPSTEYAQACFSNVAVTDNKIYIASIDNGIYSYRFEGAHFEKKGHQELNGVSENSGSNVPDIAGYRVNKYDIDGSVYTVEKHGDYYYAACGEEGIQVLDRDMKMVSQIKTKQGAVDIKIIGDYLISAETGAGLGIYKINNNALEEIGRCGVQSPSDAFTNIQAFPDNKHLLLEAGFGSYAIIDITNMNDPTIIKKQTVGNMYIRDLCVGLVADKYVGQFDRNSMRWFTINEDGTVNEAAKLESVTGGEADGVAAYGDYAIAITGNGYIYYKPEEIGDTKLSSLPVIKIDGVKTMHGKPSADRNTLVVSYIQNKKLVIADISNLDSPKLLAEVKVDGNPDVASFIGDEIIVPLRHGGILKLSKE